MRTLLRTVVVILALVGLGFMFNPPAERHREAIKSELAQRSRLAALLRLGDLAAFVSTYHSLGVASYTTANDRVLSLGALGMVVVLAPKE